jgi:hypothetical protein
MALSLRAIVDYYFLSPNTALFNSDRYKQLSGDVLLTYMIHPGTALYIGYNSRFEDLGADPSDSSGLHRTGPPNSLQQEAVCKIQLSVAVLMSWNWKSYAGSGPMRNFFPGPRCARKQRKLWLEESRGRTPNCVRNAASKLARLLAISSGLRFKMQSPIEDSN